MAYVIDRTTKEISTRDTVAALADPNVLVFHKREIPAEVRACPPQYRVIEGDTVRVATEAEREVIDNSPEILAAVKAAKIAEIDARSAELIARGLPVNHGAPISLSLAAQTNLLNIAVSMSLGTLFLPQAVSRLDGTEYAIADEDDMRRISALATARIKGVLDAGRALRILVLTAETRGQLDAIVDDRT